jgi:hypothetical protein
MLAFARYDAAQLQESFRAQVAARVASGALHHDVADRLCAEYADAANRGTYLE